MELLDHLKPECLVILKESTKQAALNELATVAAEQSGIDLATLETAIAKREELMSTGIGNGLAIPHVRLSAAKSATLAVGVTAGGIADYQSLDEKPVHIVVLIIAPQGQHDTYIRLLAKVTDVLRHEDMRARVLQAADADQLYRIFKEAE